MKTLVCVATLLLILGSACSGQGSDVNERGSSPTPAATPTQQPASFPVTEDAASVEQVSVSDVAADVTTVTAVEWEHEGDPVELCSAAVNELGVNDSEWRGWVVHDEVVETNGRVVRWLLCAGEGGSGVGAVALRSEDSESWLLTPVGGRVYHAGDQVDVVVFDADRAAVTSTALVTPVHAHAFTYDSGKTWTIFQHNRWR